MGRYSATLYAAPFAMYSDDMKRSLYSSCAILFPWKNLAFSPKIPTLSRIINAKKTLLGIFLELADNPYAPKNDNPKRANNKNRHGNWNNESIPSNICHTGAEYFVAINMLPTRRTAIDIGIVILCTLRFVPILKSNNPNPTNPIIRCSLPSINDMPSCMHPAVEPPKPHGEYHNCHGQTKLSLYCVNVATSRA